jgi:hypothetical protein
LVFFGALARLAAAPAFIRCLAELRRMEWVIYAKRPFAGPSAALAYLGRYTHRVAIRQQPAGRPCQRPGQLSLARLPASQQEQGDDAGGR